MRFDVLSGSVVFHHLSGEASTVLPLLRGCLSNHQEIVHKCITALNNPNTKLTIEEFDRDNEKFMEVNPELLWAELNTEVDRNELEEN